MNILNKDSMLGGISWVRNYIKNFQNLSLKSRKMKTRALTGFILAR